MVLGYKQEKVVAETEERYLQKALGELRRDFASDYVRIQARWSGLRVSVAVIRYPVCRMSCVASSEE